MGLTTKLNTYANTKSATDADVPSVRQIPTVSKYGPVASTDTQTVINLGFSVDQDKKEQFFLYINGQLMSEGSSFDFTFTSISSNLSSQVTLTSGLTANLNIQAMYFVF